MTGSPSRQMAVHTFTLLYLQSACLPFPVKGNQPHTLPENTLFLLKKEKCHSWWQPWRKLFWAWYAGLENWNTEWAGHSSMVCQENPTDHPSVFSTSDIPFHLVVPLIPFPFCQHGASSLKRLVVAALSSFLCFPSFAFLIFYMQNVNPAAGKSKHGGAFFHPISSFCTVWLRDQWQWLMLCDVPLWPKY